MVVGSIVVLSGAVGGVGIFSPSTRRSSSGSMRVCRGWHLAVACVEESGLAQLLHWGWPSSVLAPSPSVSSHLPPLPLPPPPQPVAPLFPSLPRPCLPQCSCPLPRHEWKPTHREQCALQKSQPRRLVALLDLCGAPRLHLQILSSPEHHGLSMDACGLTLHSKRRWPSMLMHPFPLGGGGG